MQKPYASTIKLKQLPMAQTATAPPTKIVTQRVTIQVLNRPYDKQFTSIIDELIREFGVEVSPAKGRIINLSNVPVSVLKEHPEWIVTNEIDGNRLWSFNGLNLTDKQLSKLIKQLTSYSKKVTYVTDNRIAATIVSTLPYLQNISAPAMDQLIYKLCKMIGQPSGILTEQPISFLNNGFLERVPFEQGREIMDIVLKTLPPNTRFILGDVSTVHPDTPVIVFKDTPLNLSIEYDTVDVETSVEKLDHKTIVHANLQKRNFSTVEALTYFAKLMIACLDSNDQQTKIKIVTIVNNYKLGTIGSIITKSVKSRTNQIDRQLQILMRDQEQLLSERFTMEYLSKDTDKIVEAFRQNIVTINNMPDVKVTSVVYVENLTSVVLLEFGPSVMCLKNTPQSENRFIPGYTIGIPFNFLPLDNPFLDMYSIFINVVPEYNSYLNVTRACHPHARGTESNRFWTLAMKLLGLSGCTYYKTCLGTFATELSNYYKNRDIVNLVNCTRRWTKSANPGDFWGEVSRRFTHIESVKVNSTPLTGMSKFEQERMLDTAFKRGIKGIVMPMPDSPFIQINSD